MADEPEAGPEERRSTFDLWALVLLLAFGGSVAGLRLAYGSFFFLWRYPGTVFGLAFSIGLPFVFLAAGGVRVWQVWAIVGGLSLAFYGFVFTMIAGAH